MGPNKRENVPPLIFILRYQVCRKLITPNRFCFRSGPLFFSPVPSACALTPSPPPHPPPRHQSRTHQKSDAATYPSAATSPSLMLTRLHETHLTLGGIFDLRAPLTFFGWSRLTVVGRVHAHWKCISLLLPVGHAEAQLKTIH